MGGRGPQAADQSWRDSAHSWRCGWRRHVCGTIRQNLRNHAALEELGADLAIDYRDEDVAARVRAATAGHDVDCLFDCVGSVALYPALPAVRPFGRVATILGGSGDISPLVFQNQTLHGIFLTRERRRLEEMAPLFASGRVRWLIDEVLDLRRVARAHRRLDSGHGGGKIVLEVGG